MQLNPLLALPEPDLRVLDCIKEENLEGLRQLHESGFQWSSLVICPSNFIPIYNSIGRGDVLRDFFKK